MKDNHAGKIASILCISALVVIWVLLSGCSLFNSDDEDPPDPKDQIGAFSWASPDTPKQSSFSVASYAAAESSSRGITVTTDDKGIVIEPSSFLAAYSYIALVPETMVDAIADKGIQVYRDDSDWIRTDGDTFKIDDPSLIPGYYSYRPERDITLFEAFLDEDTPVNRDAVKDVSFPIYDSRENENELKVFDVTSGETKLVLEDSMPDDLSVAYTGVAAELI